MSQKLEHKPISKVEIYKLPIGKFISDRSFLAKDLVSQEGARQAQEVIDAGTEGLSVFLLI